MECWDVINNWTDTTAMPVAYNSSDSLQDMVNISLSVSCENNNGTVTSAEQQLAWDTASPLSPAADVALALFLSLADVAAVTLNTFVIVVSIRNRKSLNPADAFVTSLAVSDLGHPLLGYPICIAAALQHRWTFGYVGCQIHGFLGFLFGINSMMSLACMSFSRLLSITQPNFARHHGVCIVAVLIAFSVVYAAFWSLCPLLGWGRYDLEPYKTSCTLQWDQPDTSFVTASFIGCLALPALVMCVSYGHITVLALATAARRRSWSKPDSAALTWSRQEVRLVKLTVAMCSVFLLNWCPYVVLAMLKAYRPEVHIPVQLTPLPALAAKCSHLVDPILYCLLNKKFRRLFPRFVTKRKVSESGGDNTTPNVALQRMLQKRVGGGDRWLESESMNVSLSTGGDRTPVTVTTTTFP